MKKILLLTILVVVACSENSSETGGSASRSNLHAAAPTFNRIPLNYPDLSRAYKLDSSNLHRSNSLVVNGRVLVAKSNPNSSTGTELRSFLPKVSRPTSMNDWMSTAVDVPNYWTRSLFLLAPDVIAFLDGPYPPLGAQFFNPSTLKALGSFQPISNPSFITLSSHDGIIYGGSSATAGWRSNLISRRSLKDFSALPDIQLNYPITFFGVYQGKLFGSAAIKQSGAIESSEYLVWFDTNGAELGRLWVGGDQVYSILNVPSQKIGLQQQLCFSVAGYAPYVLCAPNGDFATYRDRKIGIRSSGGFVSVSQFLLRGEPWIFIHEFERPGFVKLPNNLNESTVIYENARLSTKNGAPNWAFEDAYFDSLTYFPETNLIIANKKDTVMGLFAIPIQE